MVWSISNERTKLGKKANSISSKYKNLSAKNLNEEERKTIKRAENSPSLRTVTAKVEKKIEG